MSGRLLTRDEFIKALDETLAKEREESIARFDWGAQIYGETVDLTGRDWLKEAHEENLDRRLYLMFDEIRDERNLP